MIAKSKNLLYLTLCICLPTDLFANLTSMQSWDPMPVFNATNLNMPPDAQFYALIKKQIVNDTQHSSRKKFGFNLTPFMQSAIRAQNNQGQYFGQFNPTGTPTPPGQELSDYQGTAFLMGLFLGKNAKGYSIWGGPTMSDTGNVTNITAESIVAAFPDYYELQNALKAMNSLSNTPNVTTDYLNALIFNIPTNPGTNPTPFTATPQYNTSPSIFSETVLSQDPTYFGAFSTPLTYQKVGLRWEFNLDVTDTIGLILRGGLCQLTQNANNQIALSHVQAAAPNQPSTSITQQGMYYYLNSVFNSNASSTTSTPPGGAIPYSPAQSLFDQWVTNNSDYLLAPKSKGGVGYNTDTFSISGLEDLQAILFFRNAFALHAPNEDDYTSIILTPYLMLGGTIPLSDVRNYSILYSLPLGNNGHYSIGGVAGMTFDFIDSIEFGIEGGVTAFLEKEIKEMPCPNHELQRVIYPYRRDMNVTPGFNFHFSGIFNAAEFIKNTSFAFKYTYVQHTQDSIKQVVENPYFFPYLLELQTPWSSQMFVATLTFVVQPSVYLSVGWQGALAQSNAYCSNTVMASASFLF